MTTTSTTDDALQAPPVGRPTSFVVCATTRIDRTEFGLTAAKRLAGRHLDISLRIQGVRR